MMSSDDPGDSVRFIVSGQAKAVFNRDGRGEISVESLGPGDLYGEIAFLTGKKAASGLEIKADEPCLVVELSTHELGQAVKQGPLLAMSLLRTLARKIARLDNLVVQTKLDKRALKSLISRGEHVFPDYVVGDYVKGHLAPRVGEFAQSGLPLLIVGETGVGKEVLAHYIFKNSQVYNEVFLLLDLHRTLRAGSGVESSVVDANREEGRTREQMHLFFGATKSDGDGGEKEAPGYIQLSEDGTLLVRGIEHLTTAAERALWEIVTTGKWRSGITGEIQEARFRLIAATELDPSQVDPEQHPLIYGLRDHSIVIPPLRRRRRELPDLVNQYIARHSRELSKEVPRVPNLTLKTLLSYSWPGNDVELSTTLKRAVLVSVGGTLRPEDIYFDLARVEGEGKFDLFRLKPVRRAMLSPLFPAILQSAATPFFFILMTLLFVGPVNPNRNPASLFSWAVGWPALVLGSFLWGRFWCSVCPMGTLARLAKKVVSFDFPFPAILKNYSELLVAGAVLFIIWLETATHMRSSPFNLGLLLGTITALAVLVSVVFERQSWCRYLCPLGGMTGVLAQTAIVELRADRNVCASRCTSHECYSGTEDREGCPFGQLAPSMHTNQTCKICADCLKNCPHGAINLNLRIPGHELLAMQNTNTATAFLIVSMLGGLMSEIVSQTPFYGELVVSLGLPEVVTLSLVFAVITGATNAIVVIAAVASGRILGEGLRDNYNRFGLALLPLALTAFFAFHLYYLINLGVQLPILLSKNFDLAIFRQLIITVPPATTFLAQKLVVAAGLVWTSCLIYRFSLTGQGPFWRVFPGVLPHALAALVLSRSVVYAIENAYYLHLF